MGKRNLIILETHPVQYRVPLFKKLSKNKNLDLKVFFCSDVSMREKEVPGFNAKNKWFSSLNGFDYEFLKNYCPFKEQFPPKGPWNFGIIKKLFKEKPDATLVYGYQSVTHRIALLAAKILRIPIIFRDEIDFIDYNSPAVKKIKNFLLKFVFKLPSAFLYSYTRSKEYYEHLGIPEEKLFFHPCAADNEKFQKQAKEDKPKIKQIKKELGFSNRSKIVLYVGRLDSRKRVMDTLRAFSKIESDNAHLVFVGGGPEEEKIKEFSEENGISNASTIKFVKRENLHKYYSIADLFVIPSDYDPSPKTMNEAMNFSLPVITSKNVGTAKDLVKDGENGYVVEVGDIDDLSKKMQKIIENKKLREKMGKKSLEIVSKWNFDEDVKATIKSLDYIYRNEKRKKRK